MFAKCVRNPTAKRLGKNNGMSIMPACLRSPLNSLTIACTVFLVPLPGNTARADVIEIDADGASHLRTTAGAVEWIDLSASLGRSCDDVCPPPAALTTLEGPYPPAAFSEPLVKAAAFAAISPALLEALVWQESRWRQGAVSPAGAIGLGQLMPGTARQLGVDPHDPAANLMGAARYLREQLDRFDNDVERALAAYNAGPGRVERAGGIPNIAETRAYVAAITGRLAGSVRDR